MLFEALRWGEFHGLSKPDAKPLIVLQSSSLWCGLIKRKWVKCDCWPRKGNRLLKQEVSLKTL
jgi:hypothetical protein